MNDNPDTPQAQGTTGSGAPSSAHTGSSQPEAEIAAEHDTTLKWIVPDDVGATDTPGAPHTRLERTPPPLPAPVRRTTPTPAGDRPHSPVPLPKKTDLPNATPSPQSGEIRVSPKKTDLPSPTPKQPPLSEEEPASPPKKTVPPIPASAASAPSAESRVSPPHKKADLPSQPAEPPGQSGGMGPHLQEESEAPVPPPPPSDPAAEATPPPEQRKGAEDTVPRGATPTEIVVLDSTPPPPGALVPGEVVGAAPVAMLPGPASSDSELSTDAVEILPTGADDSLLPPARSHATGSDATPKEGITLAVPTSAPQVPTPSEPREVEADAVEIVVESAEQQPAPGPSPPAVKTSRQAPPPVRPDAAALTPPPVPPEVAAGRTSQAPHPPTGSAAPLDESQAPTAGGEQVPEALARRSLQKRSKPWFEEVFDEDYLRTLPFMTAEQTAREAAFIREALSPPRSGEILDIACGYGRHALELAQQGLNVTGLDLSLPLLIRAADDAQKRGLAVNFVHADMREMTFSSQFDGAYCVLSSFGYFDEETNMRVASSICQALKPGGRFLLDTINRDYVVGDLPSRVWWEGDGCVVLEEVDFNYHTSRILVRRSVVFGNGRQVEQEISMRAYSLHEVGKLLRQAGLRVLQVSGDLAAKSRFFGAASRNIIAVCERPAT